MSETALPMEMRRDPDCVQLVGIFCAYKLWKKDTGAANSNYRAFL